MIYITLFYEFFKIGLFAIGGGLATVPFLFELTNTHGWFTPQTLTDMIAVAESTPGPIGVNMATYAGFTTVSQMLGIPAGILGGICTTIGLVTPSIIIIILVSKVLTKFKESPLVQDLFYGLRPAVAGLIIAAAWQLFEVTFLHSQYTGFADMFNLKAIILFAVLLVSSYQIKIHPIFYIIIGGLAGVVFQMA